MYWSKNSRHWVWMSLWLRKVDPRGREYYWIGGTESIWKQVDGTDHEAVSGGWISVTPLHLDLTNHQAIEEHSHEGIAIATGCLAAKGALAQ